jgi:hypothetical protein
MMKKLLVMLSVVALGFSAHTVFADNTIQNATKSTTDAAGDLGKGTMDAAGKVGKAAEDAVKGAGDAFDKAADGVEKMVKGS